MQIKPFVCGLLECHWNGSHGDYRDPMEWMIDSDRHGGSCSVYKGNGLHFSYQKCGSLDAERAGGIYACLCLFVCLVQSENVHLLDGNVFVMLFLSAWPSAQNT